MEFSALDCTRFANVLQRSGGPPVNLSFRTKYIEDPLVLAEGLVNLKKLAVGRYDKPSQSARPNYPSLGDMIVEEGGNGMIQRLLQRPLSQLRILWLVDVQLDDRHFMAIVGMLPTSQLEQLAMQMHDISWRGIMAFAQQLPYITCLKTIDIGRSKEDRLKGHHDECCIALTQGMRVNYSIENMYMDVIAAQRKDRFLYYADLNYAGRKILATSTPIPDGLWTRIMERAGTRYLDCLSRQRIEASRRADTIYFLLRNCLPDGVLIYRN